MRVIVVGSGIAGASTAYHLALRGAEVIIADDRRLGVATSAGAGIISPWTSRHTGDAHFASLAGSYYPGLVAQLAEDGQPESSFAVVGGMVVSADDQQLDEAWQRISARAAGQPAAGTVERLDPAQARELWPALAPDLAAVHLSGAGRVDGRTLSASLLAAAESRNARLLAGRAALTGEKQVTVGEHTVNADKIVVAAGAWSPEFLAPLDVPLDIAPQRGQISHFELPGADTSAWPVVLPVSSHYLLAFPGSRIVAGATRETGSGFDHRVTAAGQREVLDHALAVSPGLAGATLLETRIGFRPASSDGAPLLGALTGHPHILIGTGFGPSGLTLAPYTGKLLAQLALDEEPETDLAPYRPER